MIAKTFEVRDKLTFVPVLAVKLTPTCEADRFLFGRTGYGITPEGQSKYVILLRLAGGHDEYTCDIYDWNTRTMRYAHKHIIENFDSLESGAVVDVEFILGETKQPKESEASDPLYS